MDAVSDATVQEVVVMSSAQVGKTLLLKAILGYHVHQDPAPILLLQPTLEMAEAFSKDRLAPMVRDTPVLRGRIADAKSRDSGNTLLHKRFPGGHITLAGANSPASLASRPIRVVLCDEIDRYPASAGAEGDPVNLAKKRTTTFWNRKTVLVSTPTVKGTSRIEAAYLQSDQRRYLVPCPHCDHRHALEWANLRMEEGKPETAAMVCPACGTLIEDADKPRMLRAGEWVAQAPFNGVAGFHLNELYSPWRTFADVARDYLRSKDSPEQYKTWVNTSLGETFAETGEAPEWQRVYDKREDYPIGAVAEDVVFLTAGVDVQRDRLEVEIVGWCEGKRSRSIDFRVIEGDTENLDGPAWTELARVIGTETWEHASGATLSLRYVCVDSGFRTTTVYDFCRKFGMSKVAPIKGMDAQATIISSPRPIDRKRDGKQAWRGLKLYLVGASVAKDEFYSWLRLDLAEDGTAPPGYCHFPQYGQQHFKELTSEQVMIQLDRRGFQKRVWTKTAGVRNEPLDCRVYARAAAAIVGIDRFRDREWEALRAQLGRPATKRSAPRPASAPVEQVAAPQQSTPSAKPARRRSSFW
jgi:phage terminase large subunit GpA-like protein